VQHVDGVKIFRAIDRAKRRAAVLDQLDRAFAYAGADVLERRERPLAELHGVEIVAELALDVRRQRDISALRSLVDESKELGHPVRIAMIFVYLRKIIAKPAIGARCRLEGCCSALVATALRSSRSAATQHNSSALTQQKLASEHSHARFYRIVRMPRL